MTIFHMFIIFRSRSLRVNVDQELLKQMLQFMQNSASSNQLKQKEMSLLINECGSGARAELEEAKYGKHYWQRSGMAHERILDSSITESQVLNRTHLYQTLNITKQKKGITCIIFCQLLVTLASDSTVIYILLHRYFLFFFNN